MKAIRIFLAAAVAVALLAVSTAALAGPLPKPVSKNAEAQKFIDEAWKLERTDSNAEIFKKCIGLMEKAEKLDPNNDTILTDLSRYWWNHGDNLPKETDEQQDKLEDIYEKGLDYAEKSLKVKETAGGHYWWAVNKGASLEFSSIVSQAAAFPGIYSHSQWVTEHDPQYYYGATGRLWSEILCRVPKVVVEMVGWDVQEAIDDINKAIKAEPRYLDNYLYRGRFYWVYFQDKDKALKDLDYVLKQDAKTLFPEEEPANRVSQREARKLWKEITGKDYPNK